MRYQLPPDFECKHCVVQWYWATANSCAPRGFKEYIENYNFPFGTTCDSDGGGRGTYRADMSVCGGSSLPEEFWSCADVQITPDGTSAGAVQALANPVPDPAVVADDETEVKENPQEVLEMASQGLENDITMTANEDSGKRKQEEMMAASGDCILEDQPCDGGTECCDMQQFCVKTDRAGGFTCRFWWSLWEDSEARSNAAEQ
ncbi:Cellulose/chitin-binding protein [Gracilaria domingensis]|nr:Cellulose/chitin-binding protein [Gracilaria domingensis]